MVPTDGLPFLLHEGLEVTLVPPLLKGPRSFTVTSCSNGQGGQLVGFAGVQSLGQAAKLLGKTVLVRTKDLPRDFGLHDASALMGREVHDASLGSLGTICEVLRGPANDVWVVRGAHGEVLIPAVEPLVVSWEVDALVEVDLPRGLVSECEADVAGEE